MIGEGKTIIGRRWGRTRIRTSIGGLEWAGVVKLQDGFRGLFGFWRRANRTVDIFSRIEPAVNVQTSNPLGEIPRRVS